jgi:hypothetical protein
MRDLIAVLPDDVRTQVAYLAAKRYAGVAAGAPRTGEPGEAGDVLRSFLRRFSTENWAVGDVRLRAEAESRIGEYLDQFDEEPIKSAAYPYACLMQMLNALELLGGSPLATRLLVNLWHGAERLADQLDGELKAARILNEFSYSFLDLEQRLWLGHARLTGEVDDGYRFVEELGQRIVRESTAALTSAFAPSASADYILVFENEADAEARLLDTARRAAIEVNVGPSIYLERMDDANRTVFRNPGYLYVWSKEGPVVAGLIAGNADVRMLVDSRSPSGSVVTGEAFVREPVPTTQRWD